MQAAYKNRFCAKGVFLCIFPCDGHISLSSLTRLAVSLKVSSVGEYALSFSRFWGLGGGTKGDGCDEALASAAPWFCSSCIWHKDNVNFDHMCIIVTLTPIFWLKMYSENNFYMFYSCGNIPVHMHFISPVEMPVMVYYDTLLFKYHWYAIRILIKLEKNI